MQECGMIPSTNDGEPQPNAVARAKLVWMLVNCNNPRGDWFLRWEMDLRNWVRVSS